MSTSEDAAEHRGDSGHRPAEHHTSPGSCLPPSERPQRWRMSRKRDCRFLPRSPEGFVCSGGERRRCVCLQPHCGVHPSPATLSWRSSTPGFCLSREPQAIFCTERAATPGIPAPHLARLRQAAAKAPEISPAPPPGPPIGGSWWVLRRKSWLSSGVLRGMQQLRPHLLTSLQREPAPHLGTPLGSVPSTKPGSWLEFGTSQTEPGSVP